MHTQVKYEIVVTLKKRLAMYGETTSDKKAELVQRLVSLMDSPPPDLGVGSYYHFMKKVTVATLEKFCEDNHIMIGSK